MLRGDADFFPQQPLPAPPWERRLDELGHEMNPKVVKKQVEAFRERALALVADRAVQGRGWDFDEPRATMLLSFGDSVARTPATCSPSRTPWEVLDSPIHLEDYLWP